MAGRGITAVTWPLAVAPPMASRAIITASRRLLAPGPTTSEGDAWGGGSSVSSPVPN